MKNTEQSISRVLAQADEHGITHFQAGVIDSVGRIVGKRPHGAVSRTTQTRND